MQMCHRRESSQGPGTDCPERPGVAAVPFEARAAERRPRTLAVPPTNDGARRASPPLADIVTAEKAVGKTTDEFVYTR